VADAYGSTIHPARLRSRDLRLRFDANQVTYSSITIVQVIPCHYVAGTGPIDEVDLEPMSPERIYGALHGEQALRDQYNVEAYERDLQALWQIQEDGSH